MRPSQGARPVYISSDRRDLNRISPIQINSGNGASAQDDTDPQAEDPSTRPTGAEVKPARANSPTPSNDSATQIPLPNTSSRTNNSSRPRSTTHTGFPPPSRPARRHGRPAACS